MIQSYKHQILQISKFTEDRKKKGSWRNSSIANRRGNRLVCGWNARSFRFLSRFWGPDYFPGAGGAITPAAAHMNQQRVTENPAVSADSTAQLLIISN